MAMSSFLLGWVKGRGGLAAALSPALAAPLPRSTHRHMCLPCSPPPPPSATKLLPCRSGLGRDLSTLEA